jgi:tRNA (uracil-5-)-methyltransferase TRM9
MYEDIGNRLVELNRRFYLDFGKAFAQTRRRLQPGVQRIIRQLPPNGKWLDIGCGSGTLAAKLTEGDRRGLYIGVDFSPALLDEAIKSTVTIQKRELSARFYLADMSQENWLDELKENLENNGLLRVAEKFDGILAFAVLHHIPGASNRERLLYQVRGLLPVDGLFIHSEWQLHKSERLLARRLPWETVGLKAGDVEDGDTLIDWRYALPGQVEQVGIRYVHIFCAEELSDLAERCRFTIEEEFESDGEGGKLGLYQVWKAI